MKKDMRIAAGVMALVIAAIMAAAHIGSSGGSASGAAMAQTGTSGGSASGTAQAQSGSSGGKTSGAAMAQSGSSAGKTSGAATASPFPGRILGGQARAIFEQNWKYRTLTYELYYDDSKELAKTAYAIARHAGDVDETLPMERFLSGVRGYHYTTQQVCTWLNDMLAQSSPTPTLNENTLVGLLLQDGVLRMQDGHFVATGKVAHILAASPGKTRTFERNLRHERLHVFWNEDKEFRDRSRKKWDSLSPEARETAKKAFASYAKNNERQIIEEWAVTQEEDANTAF